MKPIHIYTYIYSYSFVYLAYKSKHNSRLISCSHMTFKISVYQNKYKRKKYMFNQFKQNMYI